MKYRNIFSGLALAVLAGPGALAGSDHRFSGLLENSPFPTASQTVQKESPPLELRGWVVEDGRIFFSIFNFETQRSAWITEQDAPDGLVLQDYDPARESVTVRFGGRAHVLQLRQSKIQLLVTNEAEPASADSTASSEDIGKPALLSKRIEELRRLRAERRSRRAATDASSGDIQPPDTESPSEEG